MTDKLVLDRRDSAIVLLSLVELAALHAANESFPFGMGVELRVLVGILAVANSDAGARSGDHHAGFRVVLRPR